MFNNLIENAILYCPVGTTISIGLAASGDELVVTIADNGPGLSADDRKNVFRPFFRPESTQQTPGHGLGIPFVAAIVRLSHHQRSARSGELQCKVDFSHARLGGLGIALSRGSV
jgi:signal transduction histidine kinase